MIFKKLTTVLILLALISASLGCIGSSSNAKDIVKIIPEEGKDFIYFNLKTIKQDKDLHDIYKDMKNEWSGDLGRVDIEEVNYAVVTDQITLLGGSFDLKDVISRMDNEGYDKGAYKSVDIWVKGNKAAAIIDDKLMFGDEKSLKRTIKVIKGESGSMYDNGDVRDVVDKISEGVITRVKYFKVANTAGYSGYALMKEDKDTLKMKGVIKLDNEDNAEESIANLERDLKKEPLFDVNLKQNGKFVEFTAKMEIESWKDIIK